MAPSGAVATPQVSCVAFINFRSSPAFSRHNVRVFRRKIAEFTIIAASRDRDSDSTSPSSLPDSKDVFDARIGTKASVLNEQNVEGSKWRYERLFSNLNEGTLKHEPGNVTSAALLIAGTTIGAGILAIPAVTQDVGFVASSLTCILCWVYMVATGLLIAEVNVSTMCELGSGGVSIVSMAQRTLGVNGVRLASVTYLFIHYALLVAYVARSADILSNALGTPLWFSAVCFTGVFGGLCYFGSQRLVGIANGALVVGIVVTFAILVVSAAGNIELDSLLRANFAAIPQSIPVIALAFVYQNVVPVVCTNLEGDLSKIRTAVVVGTSIPLAMFLVWDAVILGSVSLLSADSPGEAILDPLMQLRSASGIIGPLVETFSLLAIATSYIGFVLGLSDFLADLLKFPGGGYRQPLPYLLSLLPPIGLALVSPNIFFQALDFAGAYGVLVLFGILPAAMAWSQRYSDSSISSIPPMVWGGRLTLGSIIAGAGLIITTQLLKSTSS